MNKKWKSTVSVVLCATMVAGGTGITTYAKNSNVKAEKSIAKNTDIKKETENKNVTSNDEVMYVFTGSDGEVNKIIVSDEMRDLIGNAIPKDDVNLLGMKQHLPVQIKISYELNGKKISAADLAGKDGHIKIHIDYKNQEKKTCIVDGKKEQMFVPYVMLTGMILENDVFSNVKVTNGKLVDDGDRTVVAGIALPGIQENLKISEDKLELPDYVEIEADAKGFKMMETMTIATNEIFGELDSSKFNSADGLKDSLDQMTNAMSQLMDGSDKLADGLTTLNEKTGELSNGIGQLSLGSAQLEKGASTLDAGAGQLLNGSSQLSTGLSTLASNNATLTGGAEQVFSTLLSTAQSEIEKAGLPATQLTIGNYADVLNGIIASLDQNAVYEQALQLVTAKVEEKRPLIEQAVTEAVHEQVVTQVTAVVRQQVAAKVTEGVKAQVEEAVISQVTQAIGSPMTKEQYDQAVQAGKVPQEVQEKVLATIEAQMNSEEITGKINSLTELEMSKAEMQALVASKIEEQMQTDGIKATIAENIEIQVQQKISEAMVSDEVKAKLEAASEGSKAVIQLKAALDSYNSFYLGLIAYTNGVASAAKGASDLNAGILTLKDGTSALLGGTKELNTGVNKLSGAAPALIDGVAQLKDGSVKLSDGLGEFNEKAVKKLVDAVDGDLGKLASRLKGMVNVSKDVEEPVKIIYRTEKVE